MSTHIEDVSKARQPAKVGKAIGINGLPVEVLLSSIIVHYMF